MPRLDPRQLLIREALLCGAAFGVVLITALWWVLRVPSAPPGLADRDAASAAAPAAAPLPSACLWRPLSEATGVTPAPVPSSSPTMRLISLSRRDGRWTALVDPGDGSGSQRITGGERVAGWLVDAVGQDSVELSTEGRRHQLRFEP